MYMVTFSAMTEMDKTEELKSNIWTEIVNTVSVKFKRYRIKHLFYVQDNNADFGCVLEEYVERLRSEGFINIKLVRVQCL